MNMKDFWASAGNILKAIGKGELLLRLRADKLFVHILYFFFLAWLTIFISFRIDKTLVKMGKNKEIIESLEIQNAQKKGQLIEITGISNVTKRLEEEYSTVTLPEESATIIRRRNGKEN